MNITAFNEFFESSTELLNQRVVSGTPKPATAFSEIFESSTELLKLRVVLGTPIPATGVKSKSGLVICSWTLQALRNKFVASNAYTRQGSLKSVT